MLSAHGAFRAVEQVGAGQSNLTFRIHLERGTLILRRPPTGPLLPSAHDVLREARVLRALALSTIPVPRVFAVCEDRGILGVPFYVMEALHGDAIRFELPPGLSDAVSERRKVGEQLIDALVALHQMDPARVGLANLGPPNGYIARQLKRWRGQLDHARTRALPALDEVAKWLEMHQPPEPDRVCIVHGDYKLDNAIFALNAPVQLLGIVDWELSTLGDPLADLGWLLAFWREADDPPTELPILPRVTAAPGFSSRAELAERYAQRIGQTLPDLRFYVVLALWKMAIVLEGHWARHVRGTAGSFDFAYLEDANPSFAASIQRGGAYMLRGKGEGKRT